jgi:hypothetical protein
MDIGCASTGARDASSVAEFQKKTGAKENSRGIMLFYVE